MRRVKLTFALLLFLAVSAFPQQLKFAWITDTHTGYDKSDSVLIKQIGLINNSPDVAFVIHTGDVTEIGTWEQFEQANKLLSKLNRKYFVIPGNHDTKWSHMGGMEFDQNFGDSKFRFDTLNYIFIGLNSGIVLRGGGGHIVPEQIKWLEEQLNSIKDNREIYFFVHHPLDDIDNWYKVTNLLRKKNLKGIFVGHGHANRKKEIDMLPQYMGVGSTSKTKLYGFNVVELSKDDMKITTIGSVRTDSTFIDTLFTWHNEPKVPGVNPVPTDSLDFIDHKQVKIAGKLDIGQTLVTSPVPHKNGFLAASLSGTLFNYSSDLELQWWVDLGSNCVSRPVVVGDLVFAGSVGGDIYQIDLNTGEVLQSLGINESITSQLVSIPVYFRDQQTSAVLIGTSNGTIYAYEAKDLTPIWKNSDAKGRIESLPVVLSDRVIFSAWDGMTYCVDLRTGKLNWKWSENVNFYFSTASCIPVTNGDYIWFVSPDKSVSCVDVLLGKTQWSTKDYNAWESLGLSNDGKTLWIKSVENEFHAVNAMTGKKIKSHKMKWGVDTNPVQIREIGGSAVFGLKSGRFIGYKKEKFTDLFFLGQSRGLTVEKMGDLWLASNMDGRVLLFSVK